jgi:hypothetical protein
MTSFRPIRVLGLPVLLIWFCALNSLAQTGSTDSTTTAVAKTEAAQTKEVSQPAGPAASLFIEKEKPLEESKRSSVEANEPLKTRKETDVPPVGPEPQADPEGWQFQLTPYLWIVGLSGRAGIGDLDVDVDSGITDSNVHLNFGFMATFEARKNRWLVLTDLQYSSLGTENPTPGPLFSEATADFKTFVLDPELGYRIIDQPGKASVDLLGGIRYWHLKADLELVSPILPVRFASASRDWVDGVAGIRGRIYLTPKFFLAGKADLGGGGSNFTFQLFGAAGYQVSKRIALIGGYRDLDVNYNKDRFLFDMSLAGPVFGVGIKL